MIHVLFVNGVYVRLAAEDRAQVLEEDQDMCADIGRRIVERHYYFEDVDDNVLWDYWFDELQTVGISHLLNRYRLEFMRTPPVLPRVNGRGAVQHNMRYYYQMENDKGEWVEYVFSTDIIEVDSIQAITQRRPALLFRDYLMRIGGNESFPESVGDLCYPVEVFEVLLQNNDKKWITLNQCNRTARGQQTQVLPDQQLRRFLEKELKSLRGEFLINFVGQHTAKRELISKIVAQALRAISRGHTVKINDFNQVFLGEPGILGSC